MTWQQETIAESAREVSDLGRELYKRLSTMGTHFAKLGRTLGGAVDAYNQTVGSLERQVLPQPRQFEQHGISGIEAPELAADRAPAPAARSGGARRATGCSQALEAVSAGADAA